MKLAEALSIRKDLQKRIQQLGQRIHRANRTPIGMLPGADSTLFDSGTFTVQAQHVLIRMHSSGCTKHYHRLTLSVGCLSLVLINDVW